VEKLETTPHNHFLCTSQVLPKLWLSPKRLGILSISFHPRTLKFLLKGFLLEPQAIYLVYTINLETRGIVCGSNTNLQADLQWEDSQMQKYPFKRHRTSNISHNIVGNFIGACGPYHNMLHNI
jgi:hypothetical protein